MTNSALSKIRIGVRVLSADGEVGGVIESEVNEYGNVRVRWDDGMASWSIARLIERRIVDA